MKRLSKLSGSAILAITILFGAGASTASASVSANCDFFNGLQWGCELYSPNGIQYVGLTWNSPVGPIVLWDQAYECPQEVAIGDWGDEVSGDFDFVVEECDPVVEPGNTGFGFTTAPNADGKGRATINRMPLYPLLKPAADSDSRQR